MDITRMAILSAVRVVNPDPHSKYRVFKFKNDIQSIHAFLENPPGIAGGHFIRRFMMNVFFPRGRSTYRPHGSRLSEIPRGDTSLPLP